ncbi:MAG: hypothetical protein ACJAZ4_002453 [Neptuniibacter pectenicola]
MIGLPSPLLETLCDLVTEAHTRIQKDFSQLDPIVGVSQGMRSVGIPADAMTIDCLRSGKRIIIVLHDETPQLVSYQFAFRDKDPRNEFESLDRAELTEALLYDWMQHYFLAKV